MKTFSPIAIVGQGCVFPDANTPQSFLKNLFKEKISISNATEEEWNVFFDTIINPSKTYKANTAWHARGGIIRDFKPSFKQNSKLYNEFKDLGDIFQWSLHAVHQALVSAKVTDKTILETTGLVMGNLSYPTQEYSDILSDITLSNLGFSTKSHNPLNRFSSGLPAIKVANALGLKKGGYSLDAACSSSLYAIKLAVDELHSMKADMMIAGGVSASDHLFLNLGFTALNALSLQGKSRPFHKEADGLIPSQGAAALVLKRLEDAERDGDTILGVIRGIGLSNDGKSGGFLAPSVEGQITAMKQALSTASILPKEVSFIECHATGTQKGDELELQSVSNVYGKNKDLLIGSLKSNLGHSITASGMAGVIKLLGAFKANCIPGTVGVDGETSIAKKYNFIVHNKNIDWPKGKRKIGAVSNFGFGGNNAHILIEAYEKGTNYSVPKTKKKRSKVAVVALDLQTESFASIDDYYLKKTAKDSLEKVAFKIDALGFPPNDLKLSVGQQTLVYNSVKKILENKKFSKDKTGVFVGMSAQEIASYESLKARLDYHLSLENIENKEIWLEQAKTQISSELIPGKVFGTMPNIHANRINNFFDITNMGFTISAEELSGDRALKIAIDNISNGILETAVVSASDVPQEITHRHTSKTIHQEEPGVVSLLLKSEAAAINDGDTILAWIDVADVEKPKGKVIVWEEDNISYPHVAKGLVNIVKAIKMTTHYSNPESLLNFKDIKSQKVWVKNNSQFGDALAFNIEPYKEANTTLATDVRVYPFAGSTVACMKKLLRKKRISQKGKVRLAIVCVPSKLETHIEFLESLDLKTLKTGWINPNVYFCKEAPKGEVAFAFTGSAAAYKRNGIDFLKSYSNIIQKLVSEEKITPDLLDWIVNDDKLDSPFNHLVTTHLLSLCHAEFSQQHLNIKPDAVLGISAGETNSIYATGIWKDNKRFFEEDAFKRLYDIHLAGKFEAVKKYWKTDEKIDWKQWIIIGDLDHCKELIKDNNRVFIGIINTNENFLICGDQKSCIQVIEKLNPSVAAPINHDFVCHCPPLFPVEKVWYDLHKAKTSGPGEIRYYAAHFGGQYIPTEENVAEALTGCATRTINFPKVVNEAWKDGIRIFVEHGPRNSLSGYISDILKGKEHYVVSLDKQGENSMKQILLSTAQLWTYNIAELPNHFIGNFESNVSTMTFPVVHPLLKLPPLTINKTMYSIKESSISINPECNHQTMHSKLNIYAEKMLAPNIDTFESVDFVSPEEKSQPNISETVNVSEQTVFETEPMLSSYDMLVNNRIQFSKLMHKSHTNYMQVMQRLRQSLIQRKVDFKQNNVVNTTAPVIAPTPIRLTPPDEYKETSPLQNFKDTNQFLIKNNLPGPKFNRRQLEHLSSGKISQVFGPLFEQQDQYDIQVRMPQPPLLLCDRVTGIQGEPGTLKTGVMWTETDVTEGSWYLHNNRMPAGVFIEAGQADLLLISWLGIDFKNKGERAYRLLGCELTFHNELPKVGETLKYEIHIDGYANNGDITLFFFHYDCWVNNELKISVRSGQAGFFTKQELKESAGVIWNQTEAEYTGNKDWTLPARTSKNSYTEEDVLAYTNGDMIGCFGDVLFMTQTHTRTPRSSNDKMNFIQTVPVLDFEGGPSGRGYMRSVWKVSPDDWFFKGHFKNDECMPGTLMAEACLQMMSFYMVGAGLTTDKDGWRFEPVSKEKLKFICRGQVTPTSKDIIYEIFVTRIEMEPTPVMYAHVMCTVDGELKAFLCENMGLRLVIDWPITSNQDQLLETSLLKPSASYEGFNFDKNSIINATMGPPDKAFGPLYEDQNYTIPTPRLPLEPYLCVHNIQRLSGIPGDPFYKFSLVAEYEIQPNAWYFRDNKEKIMPYAVLMEIGLQPCGWLSTYYCNSLIKNKHLLYRNLDGNATQYFNVTPLYKTIETHVKVISSSVLGATILISFDVQCFIDGELLLEMNTGFGYFEPESMISQKGHTITDEEKKLLALSNNVTIPLKELPKNPQIQLSASNMQLMIDRVIYFDKEQGTSAKGYIRAEKDVHPSDWYFKAHFYSDPVQPGSLGIEAIIQLIQSYLMLSNTYWKGESLEFEPILLGEETEWHYRGQVVPKDKLVIVDFEVKEETLNDTEHRVFGEARLWVNGLKIYHCPKIGCKVRKVY